MTAILSADDDMYVLYSIWKALKAEGYTVLTASNGPAALETSRKYLGPIDLLITSVALPRMNGLELSEAIKAERPAIKVLLMSRDSRESVQASIPGLFLLGPSTYCIG